MTVTEQQIQEIEKLRKESKVETIRPISPELENILYQPIPVLDHGFIRVIDYMGNDSSIVQAARVSYGSGTKKINQDKGLIFYLLRHRHTTPFEMCEIKFHIKLPIFIARQWIRHRTANVNEYSARYSILGKDFYMPERDQLAAQSTINMQGRGEVLNDKEAKKVMQLLEEDALRCYENYEYMLNENQEGNKIDESRSQFARELARMNLTLNYYTEWYWKIDLHNFLHFLKLRADSHAQYEIRVYGNAMLDIAKRWVPLTYAAFEEYSLKGAHISGTGIEIIKRMMKGKKVAQEESGMSKREWQELMSVFGF
jgi:thymidylate synthase (FAD)